MPRQGQVTPLVLVGLLLLAIPAGLTLTKEVTTILTTKETTPTPTQIVNITDTSPVSITPTPTEDPPTKTEDTPSDKAQPLVVDDVVSDDCPDAAYTTIQGAVNDANQGRTIVVCEGMYREQVDVNTGGLTIRADGNAVIKKLGGSAVRITTPQVTIQGFVIKAATDAENAIEVGGRDALIRDNTIEPTGPDNTGIFLGDGRTAQGDPDPEFGAASQTRIVNNTINAGAQTQYGIRADAEQTDIQNNTIIGGANTTSILSSGNETVIRKNTVRYPNRRIEGIGINIGKLPQKGHNFAIQNVVMGNTVAGGPDRGILVGADYGRSQFGPKPDSVAKATVVRDNTVINSGTNDIDWPGAIFMISNETVVRNNTVLDSGHTDQSRQHPGKSVDGVKIAAHGALVVENTIERNEDGLSLRAHNATIKRNNIRNNQLDGMDAGSYPSEGAFASGLVRNNTLTGNAGAGIRVVDSPDVGLEAHYNHILNNGGGGIINYNLDPTDGEWPIMNATHNIWDCGGPSTGLKDPYTQRVANGSGDAISAGDEPAMSNVHFDPFLERSGCPSLASTPTPTSTTTATTTPTPTVTSTPTPTVTPTPARPNAVSPGGVGSKGTDTGAGKGESKNPNHDAENDGKANRPNDGLTAQSTPTVRPKTPPTPTVTPTPVVEPGFGAITGLIGVAILVGLLALRRQVFPDSEETHD